MSEGIKKAGVKVGARGDINFIEGSNITLTIDDDASPDGDNDIDITITSSGGGGGHTIQDDDAALTARTNLSFQDGFVITDDAGGDQTEVDLSYGAAGYPVDISDTEADGTAITVARADHAHSGAAYLKESDFTGIDFLVGTATAVTAAEIVVGTTPGGELGGTWAAPTVDATHSGSTHSAATDTHIADTADAHDASAISILDTAAQITATDVEGALAEIVDAEQAHVAAADPHTGYVLESLIDAKGDVITATADNTPARLAVGANDTILMADSAETTGLKWSAAAGTGEIADIADAEAAGTSDTWARGDHVHSGAIYRKEADDFHLVTFSKEGNLSTGTGTIRFYNDSGRTLTFREWRASVGTAPATSDIIVDVNVDATTIMTGTKVVITASTNTGSQTTFSTTTIADGSYITVDIDQVGTGTVGADLSVSGWVDG